MSSAAVCFNVSMVQYFSPSHPESNSNPQIVEWPTQGTISPPATGEGFISGPGRRGRFVRRCHPRPAVMPALGDY